MKVRKGQRGQQAIRLRTATSTSPRPEAFVGGQVSHEDFLGDEARLRALREIDDGRPIYLTPEQVARWRVEAGEEWGRLQQELESARSGLYRKLLRMQLEDVLEQLGFKELKRSDLTKKEFRALSERLNEALDHLTGTSRRDRALVWLDGVMQQFAARSKGAHRPRFRVRLSSSESTAVFRERGDERLVGYPFPGGRTWFMPVFGDHRETVDVVRFTAESLIYLPWHDGPLHTGSIGNYLHVLSNPRR